MPPPEEPLLLPRPKPKPPKPKPKQPKPEPVRDQTGTGGVPARPDPVLCAVDCSATCALYKYCPPPPPPPAVAVSRSANVHLRSARLPTPLIALSASLLAVSVVLLLTLLGCHLARRRRRRRGQDAAHEAPLTAHHHGGGGDVEGVPVAVAGVEEDGEGGVHHVWYIRTVGLDERAISAITALVYDAKKCGVELGGDGGGGCAVCLADFRDGETLRLLPRCRHAFHRGCIDTWLRAHVNCPLCRAPVQPASAAAANTNFTPGAATAAPSGHPSANPRAMAASEAGRGDADGMPERAVRRAASMVALPRRELPADASLRTPASNSWREGETGLAKATRLMKFSEVLEMAGVGVCRSVSFGAASGGPARRPPAPMRCHSELLDAAAPVTMRD